MTKAAWVVRYSDADGNRRLKTFAKKKEADRFRARIEADHAAGIHIAQPRTVKMICREFLHLQEDRRNDGRIGQGRLVNLRRSIDRSVIPRIGNKLLRDLKSTDIEDLYVQMCREDGLSPETAKHRVFELRLVEDFALRRGYVARAPVREAMRELRGVPKSVIRTFSHDEIGALLRAADERGHGRQERSFQLLRCSVHLATFCGLRWGEIMGLSRQSIDLLGGIIRVRHNLTQWEEHKKPKTPAGVRDVPVPPHLIASLSEWLARFYVKNERELVFRTPSGKKISAPNFHAEYWQPLLDRAGLLRNRDNLHFHALRHFAASWMIENGLPLTEVAKLLGHKKFDTTLQIYAHPTMNDKRRLDALDAMATRLLLENTSSVVRSA